MTKKEIKENAGLEVARADESLKAAQILMKAGLYREAVSRTYYFTFHNARALLYTIGLDPKTHDGVNHLLHLHFIKDGRIEPGFGKLLLRLQKYREQADYDPAVDFTKKDVQDELLEAVGFARSVAAYLKKRGF